LIVEGMGDARQRELERKEEEKVRRGADTYREKFP